MYCNRINPSDIVSTSLKKLVPTRWNSCLTMLKSIIGNKIVINDLLGQDQFESPHLFLRKQECDAIVNLINFLHPFKIQTDLMQGELYPTLSFVCPAVQQLMLCCQPDNAPLVSSFQTTHQDYGLSILKSNVKKALQRRFPVHQSGNSKGLPINEFYRLATSFDIRFKSNKAFYTNVDEFIEGINEFSNSIGTSFFVDERLDESVLVDPPETVTLEVPSSTIVTPSESESSSKKPKFSRAFAGVVTTLPSLKTNSEKQLRDDIAKYLALPNPSIKDLDEIQLGNWWFRNRDVYPVLAKVAKRLISIVATSAPSERVFSTGGNIVTQKRSRLTSTNVDMYIFLAANSRFVNPTDM
ncbi:hypothetical protein GHT06_001546 [Daphnia sinensis]|uniref:HAT C-terminal dimerisation domain-containing protein n=1 Tax=Daphnia sinensis TaxID=1820382 RepID=A0AAD5PK88_9CRUS|nr:hypothetical protein GHT06_003101 [Daphnia sinensis]KAI9550069.1 hypothetical protein GHT06_001546 [Daphnia sinensis]